MADTREPGDAPAHDQPAEGLPPSMPAPPETDPIPWSDQFLWPDRRWGGEGEAGARDLSFLRAALAGVLVLALALLVWSSRAPPPDHLPTALWGRWTAMTPPFAGRGLVISESEIGFDQGDGQVVRYQVRRVRHEEAGTRHRYRVTYRAEGGEAELVVEHDPAAGALRLPTRPSVIWRR